MKRNRPDASRPAGFLKTSKKIAHPYPSRYTPPRFANSGEFFNKSEGEILVKKLTQRLFVVCVGLIVLIGTAQAASVPFGFYKNDRVKSTQYYTLNARQYAGTSYAVVGTIPAGTRGTIQGGPVTANSYVWWLVKYDNGVTGWSAQADSTDILLNLVGSRSTKNFNGKTVITSDLEGSYLNVRSGSSVFKSVTAQVVAGTIGVVDAGPVQDDAYVWWRVRWSGNVTGWSAQRYLAEYVEDDPAALPALGVYPGVPTDEGYNTRSFLALSEPVGHSVSLRVSTYDLTTNSADYDSWSSKRVTIPAGRDYLLLPVTTRQNDDPADADQETFQLCIDGNSVSGAVVNQVCANLTINDVPIVSSNVSAIVYDDDLGQGWENWSWDTTIDYASLVHYDGTFGLESIHQTPWQGLAFGSEGFSTVGYDTLSFAVTGRSLHSGEDVWVGLYRSNGTYTYVALSWYLEAGALKQNEWEVVHIPLRDLDSQNTTITQVIFTSGTTEPLYLDEISFLKGDCQ